MTVVAELRDVGLTLHGKDILRGVDLPLRVGVTALVGRNGAGKTSLIRVVTGVLSPGVGAVQRYGLDLSRDPGAMARHRRDLGWLPQEAGLPPRMLVRDFLGYAAWLKRFPARDTDALVGKAMDHADLADLQAQRLGRLSGGQRRRVALAAALVGEPGLVLLDEPTAGLDPVQRERLLARIRALAEERAVLLATHLLEDLALCADRWCALDDGRIVGAGDVDRASGATTAQSLDEVRAVLSAGSERER